MPTPKNLRQLILGAARHEMSVKPLGAVLVLYSGVPTVQQNFWGNYSVSSLRNLYKGLTVPCDAIIQKIEEPEQFTSTQSRVLGYLTRFIGSMKPEELRHF